MYRFIISLGAFALVSFQMQIQGSPRVAAAKSTYLSLQFTATSSSSPEYGPLLTQWTTYDGTTDFPLYQVSGGTYFVSGEFAPGANNTYVADYLATASGNVVEYGDMTLTLPFVDVDHDNVPDLLQPELSVVLQITGSMHSDYPFSLTHGWSGTLSRSAGTQVGLYNLTRFDAQNDIMNGSWQVGVYTGAITYDRSTKGIQFQLVSKSGGASITNTGSTTFTVLNANQIALPEFVLTSSSSGTKITNLPSVFERTGNTYLGNMTLRDGAPSTFWPDYTKVRMTLVDTNDLDGNGIPDLSDAWGDAPAFQSQPADVHANVGNNVSFVAGVTGTAPLSFQWFFNGAPLAGQTSPLLQINNVQLTNVGFYTLTISNIFDAATSRAALLLVNHSPTITLISPPDQSSFTAGDQITISADAHDSDGTISKVDFFDGGTLIATITASPYSLQRTFAEGIHTITAKVTDDGNALITSNPVAFTVLPINQLPTVSLITPTPDAVYLTNRTVTAEARAFDSDGPITQVQFVLNNIPGATTFTNFITNMTGLAPGKYTLKAIATDNRGGATTSAPVNFSVVVTPKLLSLTRDGTNAVNILASGTGAVPHVLQLSLDLNHWVSVATNTGRSQIAFTDQQRQNTPQQFYRVIVP